MAKPDLPNLLDDPDGLPVLEDLMRTWEGEHGGELPGKVSAAHVYWLNRVDARDPERRRTLYVVDANTTLESYPEVFDADPAEGWRAEVARRAEERNGSWPYWFRQTRMELRAHPKAVRLRVVYPFGHYLPALGEVVLVRRKKRDRFYVDARCNVPECVHAYPLLQLTLGGER